MVVSQAVLLGFVGLVVLAWIAVALVRKLPGCAAMLVGAILVWICVLVVLAMR